jgi:ribonuclease HI
MRTIYADGSSLGNPGKGGWAFLVIDNDRGLVWEFGGGREGVTNNQMELEALIQALAQIQKSKTIGKIEIKLDSEYVLKGATIWYKNWIKNNWIKADKKPVLNKEQWALIVGLMEEAKEAGFEFTFTHVYGHTGEIWNERVDEIAKAKAKGEDIVLRSGDRI